MTSFLSKLSTVVLLTCAIWAAPAVAQKPSVELSVESASSGNTVTVPMTAERLNDVGAFSVEVNFDPSVLTPTGDTLTTPTGRNFQFGSPSDGTIAISFASTDGISIAKDTLLQLTFTYEGGSSALSFGQDRKLTDTEANPIDAAFVGGGVASSVGSVELGDVTGASLGQEVTVSLSASDLNNVGSADIAIDYDTDALAFKQGASSSASFFEAPNASGGTVFLVGQNVDGSDLSGDIAQLTFEFLGGSSSLNMTNTTFTDPQENPLFATRTDGSVSGVSPVLSVPDTVAITGETIDIPVRANRLTDVGSVDLRLDYSGTALSFVETVSTTSGLNLSPNSPSSGTVILTGLSTQGVDVGDSLAVLRFRASSQELSTNVSFNRSESVVTDPNENAYNVTYRDGAVTIRDNRPPTISSISDQSVSPNPKKTTTVQAEASDPDGDDLSYSLVGDQPTGLSIDDSGLITFSPEFSQRGSSFTVTVKVSDGFRSDQTSFQLTVQELNRSSITADASRNFTDPTSAQSYELVGLPGDAGLSIAETLQGEPGKSNNWRAFWDDGSETDGIVEFQSGSSTFNFQKGRGFWVLSRDPWSVSQTVQPVSLTEQANATIPLHSGWNIIANPLGNGPDGGGVPWSAVQDENGISEPLFSYNGGFSQSNSFASAKDGEAYYFLNSQGLSELKIPYYGAFTPSSASEKSTTDRVKALTVSATKDGETLSSVQVGLSSTAEKGKDRFDHYAPPMHFDNVRLQVQNSEIQDRYPLAADVRPASPGGQSFPLTLTTEPGTELTLRAEGFKQFSAAEEIRLYDASNAKTYDLRADRSIEVEPSAKNSRFVLLLGDESYVSEKQSDLVPQKVTLHQNYPNPFRSQTTLKYALPERSDVTIQVFDLLGRKVRTLARGSQEAGTHTVRWDARGQGGGSVASGTYLVRLRAGDQIRTMKVTLVK
ncbi:MAG: cohesin domain-containing protein [Salinibacter sp.]